MGKEFLVSVIPGDGIGPEITRQAVRVLERAAQVFGHTIRWEHCVAGTEAHRLMGTPLPESSLAQCLRSDAVLLGNMAIGQHSQLPIDQRPEYALMLLRRALGISTNLRPVALNPMLVGLSPLKESVVGDGFDILTVRDLSGGVIMSRKHTGQGEQGREAYEKEYYNEQMIEETVRWAFQSARHRRSKVTSVDKAVALSSSVLWRQVVTEVAEEYPDIALEHLYVDDTALRLVQNPGQFDVIVTSNLFGDILSDEIAGLSGIPSMLPAASINGQGRGIFEPNQLHCKDLSIVGQDQANPIGLVLSVAMLFDYALKQKTTAVAIQKAVQEVLCAGYATRDFYVPGKILLGTEEMGEQITSLIG